jgi:hypothetical protein
MGAMPVALSFEAFAKCFREFSRIAAGRSNPVELEANPLLDSERNAFLRRVDELNEKEFDPAFWEVMLTEG